MTGYNNPQWKGAAMVYAYISLLIMLIIAVTGLFCRVIKSSKVPANAQLLIDAWNSVSEKK